MTYVFLKLPQFHLDISFSMPLSSILLLSLMSNNNWIELHYGHDAEDAQY
jgi:hypothetical protein